jgi:hypothetical protein
LPQAVKNDTALINPTAKSKLLFFKLETSTVPTCGVRGKAKYNKAEAAWSAPDSLPQAQSFIIRLALTPSVT